MATMKHTPTPWEATAHKIFANSRPIASVRGWATNNQEDSDNAAFIVRACNCHDELVAALTELMTRSSVLSVLEDDQRERYRAILAKATKGE